MEQNRTVKILNIFLVVLTVIASIFTAVLIYYKTIGKNKVPSAVTSTYASYVYDSQTGKKLPVLESRYYANYNGSGYEVTELVINCYSGFSKQAVYSRGFQLVRDKNGKIIEYDPTEKPEGFIKDNVWHYDKNQNESFLTGHNYGWGDPMFIDIDNQIYAIKLDGTYTVHHKNFNLGGTIWNGIKNTFTLHWGRDSSAYDEWDEEFQYTWKDLLIKIEKIIKSYSSGTGDYTIPLIDLGDFLHVYSVDENGKISGQPLGANNSENTYINSYFTMDTHYDLRGMVWAEQSIFKSVAGDSQFNISGIETDVNFWKVVNEIELTEQSFEKRYVTVESGYYYSLSTETISELKNFKNSEIVINFNLDNIKSANVLGFDYYSLYGLKISNLTITSSNAKTFKLLTGSLKETGLTNETISLTNVTLENIGSGVDL